MIARFDELVAEERARQARAVLETELARDGLDPRTRWRLELRRARAMASDSSQAIDEAIFALEDLLADPIDDVEEVAIAHAALVACWTDKRLAELAARAVDAAIAWRPDHPRVLVARGRAALAFDDRVTARSCFERALANDPDASIARYAMADLLYVLGDFVGSHAQLDAIPRSDPRWASAHRLRATLHATVGDHGREAECWREVLEHFPDGDHAQQDGAALAFALAAAGRHGEALEALRAAWRRDPDSDTGRYVRKRIEYLERVGDGPRGRRLPAFPTTSQKWDYCGPAVLELCLRYLDLELGQDEIAETVKRGRGTPMYEIVAYLGAQGIEARRVEATPERLRAAIDLGLPVIVQEEYSTMAHVAVVTGYDAALGLFVAADPATHRPLLKSFEWTERAGALFGNGGVIVLGRAGPELEALRVAADEVGLVEARHLSLLDECDRLRPQVGGADAEDAALEEVLRLCDEALALSPRFKLAWHRRLDAHHHLYRLRGLEELRHRALADLHAVRTRFPDDEWPHQLHGHWLFDEARYLEAFVEYFEASRHDPADANNRQAMGECRWLTGDLVAAERHMLEAIAREPQHARAAENLSAVYLRQLQEITEGVDATAASLGPARVVAALDRSADELRRRADHFNRVARAAHPDNPFNHDVAGALAVLVGDHQAAVTAYREARQLGPERPWSLFNLAGALEAAGEVDEARELLESATRTAWHLPRTWLALGGFLARHRGFPAAAEVLLTGILRLTRGRELLAEEAYRALEQAEGAEAAAARLAEVAADLGADHDLLREVAFVLEQHHQRGPAIGLLRGVVERAPGDVNALYRLGTMLGEDLLTREEGRELLERVVVLAPTSPPPRRQLAWLTLDDAPERGLELLAPILESQDPAVFDTRAALLEALGRTDEAAASLEHALRARGEPGLALVELSRWHLDANRYDRALTLARRIFDHPIPETAQELAEAIWLAAHRLAGAAHEALPRMRRMCEGDDVPRHLAFDVYWACRSIDHDLAARAALVVAASEDQPARRLEWEIHAAKERAELGDDALLESVRARVDSAEGWANLAYAYEGLRRFDAADEAADRAFAMDPHDREALSAMQEAWVRRGDLERSIECATRLSELYPYEHQGPERLGALLGKSFELEPALELSERAVTSAPFCHNAHWSRAVTLFAAGDLVGAETHARRALALDEPLEADPGNDCVMILRALAGDAEGLDRCLARLEASEPVSIFADFKARLRDVARRR